MICISTVGSVALGNLTNTQNPTVLNGALVEGVVERAGFGSL